MDLKKLSETQTHFDDPVEVALYDELGEPEIDHENTAVTVLVVGEHSKPVQKIARQQQLVLTRLSRQYGGYDKIPQKELDALNTQRTAAAIVGWTGMWNGGEKFAHSFEAACVLVEGLRTYKPDQLKRIETAISQHASFFVTPSAN